MFKSYKYRIYPTIEQELQLTKFFGGTRFVYNLALETKIQAWKTRGVNYTKFDLFRQLTELKHTDAPWLRECPSQLLQASIDNLDKAYKNFFKRGGFPKFKNKWSKQSIRFHCGDSVKVNFEKNEVYFSKVGIIKTIFNRRFEGHLKQAVISKTTTNKYYVSILVDTKKEAPIKQSIKSETSIGIDLGLKTFFVLSDGSKIENPKFLRNQLKRLRIEQRSLSRKKKGGKNREKQRLKVAKLYEYISNQRLDFLHKTSSKIISDNQTIIVEDLAVTNMVQNHKLALSISDVSWSEFIRQLEYKSEWYGKNFIKIGRFEPSSQIHNTCGYRNKGLKLSQRYWQCPSCKKLVDRDLNAAINIKDIGLRNQPLTANVSQ